VQHQYCLTDEQGPAHRKVFFVKLKLGDEEFDASGASIKKAQHAAASAALDSTKLPRPPPKRLSIGAAVAVSSECVMLSLSCVHPCTMVAWHSSSIVGHISAVSLFHAWLVLGWATISGYDSWCEKINLDM